MGRLPEPFVRFTEAHPAMTSAYEALGAAAAAAGPLDGRTRELVKLALAIGARLEGAVHAHVRRALEAGVPAAELRHVVALAVPTLGFPTAVAASTWVEEILSPRAPRAPDR